MDSGPGTELKNMRLTRNGFFVNSYHIFHFYTSNQACSKCSCSYDIVLFKNNINTKILIFKQGYQERSWMFFLIVLIFTKHYAFLCPCKTQAWSKLTIGHCLHTPLSEEVKYNREKTKISSSFYTLLCEDTDIEICKSI